MNKKLVARLAALFIFVVAISAAVIYFTFDIRTFEYLHMFEAKCILLALGSLFVGLFFDGLRLITLADITESLKSKLKPWKISSKLLPSGKL